MSLSAKPSSEPFGGQMTWLMAVAALRQRPLRTLLTALGIAVAVASTVVFMSIGEGLRRAFADQLTNLGPDLQISYGADEPRLLPVTPDLPWRFLDELEANRERFGISRVTPVLLYMRGGLDPSQSYLFEGLPTGVPMGDIFTSSTILEGRALGPKDEGALVAVMGTSAAARARIGVGGELRLNPATRLSVVGIARSDGGLLDNLILVPITTLQQAIGVTDRLSLIAVDLLDPQATEQTAALIRGAYPELGVQSASNMINLVSQSLRVSDFVRLGISTIALLVGAIAVANTMMMSVFERTREFGVARAVGAKPRFLFGLVVVESLLLSLAGAAVGVLLGRLAVSLVNVVADGYIGLAVAALTPRLIVFAVLVALFMGLVAGLLPASRASRIPIAVALARD